MSLWVKICGNTSLEDARLAADAGADALGFVFATSPRQVTAEQVAQITPHLPTQIEKIGVFVDATFSTIVQTVTSSGLTGVQLHASNDATLTNKLRDHFGPQLRILRVAHFGADNGLGCAAEATILNQETATDAVLIDSRTAKALGGTGIAFDWAAAREQVFLHLTKPTIVAGGLNPFNVAEAIRILSPWGVDAVSGVEAAPGKKDAEKVRAFLASARAAAGI